MWKLVPVLALPMVLGNTAPAPQQTSRAGCDVLWTQAAHSGKAADYRTFFSACPGDARAALARSRTGRARTASAGGHAASQHRPGPQPSAPRAMGGVPRSGWTVSKTRHTQCHTNFEFSDGTKLSAWGAPYSLGLVSLSNAAFATMLGDLRFVLLSKGRIVDQTTVRASGSAELSATFSQTGFFDASLGVPDEMHMVSPTGQKIVVIRFPASLRARWLDKCFSG